MEQMDKNVVIILKGSKNCPVWKFRTVIALKSKELYDMVENPRNENLPKDELSKWIKRDQLAQNLIVTKMDEGSINHILIFDTAHDMWQKLLTVYDKKSEVSVHIVQQKFFNYKYEGQGLAARVPSLEVLRNQLKQLGKDMSDRMLITKILMTFPNDFVHFASVWESVDENKQTLNELMSGLLI
ncbi:hypothetical protein ILUMI_18595 [Ignelater luminosus]|uniref:Uncharacterized protein n=1 Tax=Ignelater luminosus TaxID=2038154 RepID=A0A8K0G6Q5_IGNLU|nr:hypothetical protein ILUMI_18595 [Ignelater luminosus]